MTLVFLLGRAFQVYNYVCVRSPPFILFPEPSLPASRSIVSFFTSSSSFAHPLVLTSFLTEMDVTESLLYHVVSNKSFYSFYQVCLLLHSLCSFNGVISKNGFPSCFTSVQYIPCLYFSASQTKPQYIYRYLFASVTRRWMTVMSRDVYGALSKYLFLTHRKPKKR